MSPDSDIANISADDDLKVGALADGLATSAVNSTEVDDGSTGLVGVANTNNSNNTNTTDTDVDVKNNGDNRDNTNNGDNRDNSYNWDYDNKVITKTDTDTDINIKDNGDNRDNSYDYDYKAITKTDTDVHTEANNNGDNRDNYSDSSTHSDYDFGTIKDVHDVGNLGVAGGDLTFNLGDDYSFNLNIDGVLNNALGGGGNDTGFSLVQANNLADQDQAYDLRMQNQDASINLTADGGHSHADGLDLDPTLNWNGVPSVGHDMTGTASADSSAIIANSGFHQEVVQGANLLTNSADIAVVGGDHHVTTGDT
ncbi:MULTISPECIES: fibrinogen-binding protein [unclassified Rhizobium]|uniref:fibrinogen-binding protein n=1 Tax=unclassified Rhizobium TaxID=2613769 RepID=UPI000CF1E914|nr:MULTISPECIES: fibrinogen-binding protein [Rhizobium]MDK4737536.1 fibrinogen-binding protein [Rhizobium sp. CNPSo 3464]UWU22678.1 fibrinogen-binding protein [Rhizobium tropici]